MIIINGPHNIVLFLVHLNGGCCTSGCGLPPRRLPPARCGFRGHWLWVLKFIQFSVGQAVLVPVGTVLTVKDTPRLMVCSIDKTRALHSICFTYQSGTLRAQSQRFCSSSKACPNLQPLRLGMSPLTQT